MGVWGHQLHLPDLLLCAACDVRIHIKKMRNVKLTKINLVSSDSTHSKNSIINGKIKLKINFAGIKIYSSQTKFTCLDGFVLTFRYNGLFTLHGNRTGMGTGTWTRKIGDNGSGSRPCLGPVWTFLYNILGPIAPGPAPRTCPGSIPVQCE